MKKFLLLALFIGILFIVSGYFRTPQVEREVKESSPTENLVTLTEKKSIFLPEWTVGEETIPDSSYDRWIYFGSVENRPTNLSWATLKVNSTEELKDLVIEKNNLEGVVLDLEINGLPTEGLINEINGEVEKVYNQAKANNVKLALALYGDLFYRQRPYDLQSLNQFSDEIMVMAYDFNKSYGEPGPNFPYENFKKMINQYLEFIPPEKLTIIFGMYGYDWTMKDGKPLKVAEALTLNQIKSRFSAKIKAAPVSKEKNISYKDEKGYDHVIFFEDEESAAKKIDYLKEKGIGSITYWAWGYF